jgi:flagellar basal-body rod modification protein FlgD
MTAASPVSSLSNSSLLNSYIQQTQTATTAAEQQMAQNVSNGVDASGSSSTGVTGNFNTFLQILTTQLQNQDPTSPMDTSQFTQELVEFSGVEQQLNTNSLLQQLVTASGASGVKSLLGYVGQYVEVPANNQLLIQNGQSDFSYSLPSAAQNVSISVLNSSNQQVAQLSGPTASGTNNVSWNGQDSSGNQLPDGVYTLSVQATDSSGNPLTVSNIQLIGQVTGVQTADSNGNDLQLGPNLVVKDSNVDAVFPASSLPTSTSTTPSSTTPSS